MTPETSPFQTPEQRSAERSAKREAVLLAAVRLFNENGFHKTSLDEVAALLGVSKPTIYHYLGNKEQVLVECVSRGLDQMLDALRNAQSLKGTGAERLAAFLEQYGLVIMGDFGRCTIRSGEESLSEDNADKVRSQKRQITHEFTRLIEAGQEDGTIANHNAQVMTFVLAGALNWSAFWHDPDGKKSSKDVASEITAMLASGFIAR